MLFRHAAPPQSALVLQFGIQVQLHRHIPRKVVAMKSGSAGAVTWLAGVTWGAAVTGAKRSSAGAPQPPAGAGSAKAGATASKARAKKVKRIVRESFEDMRVSFLKQPLP
jgi:hypothetical protein